MKHGFLFLVEKHKALQQSYEKEKQKNLLLEQTLTRLEDVTRERNEAYEEAGALRKKCLTMAQVI
jgi:5-bromo-4-chloroindolyl phosphate hydrolysis protein